MEELKSEDAVALITKATELLEKASKLDESVTANAKLLEKTVSSTTSSTFAQREHLDQQIADVTRRNTPFLDMVARKRANGLTHEWDMIVALGSNDTATAECGTPADNEITLQRYSAQIKTFATKVKVCDRAQWGADDYFDLMQTHLEGGMRKILHDVETKCFYGDSSVEPAEFDGLYKLIVDNSPAANVVDANGATITTTMVDSAIQAIVDQGGTPTHVFMGAKALKDFSALWAGKVVWNDPGAGMTFGYNVARYMSFAGPVQLVLDPFITAAASPNTNPDVFVLDMSEIALAEAEPMYKLPTYRGLDLAETQTVVWNVVLELKNPFWAAVIKNVL